MSSMNSLSFAFAISADVSLRCMFMGRLSSTGRHTLQRPILLPADKFLAGVTLTAIRSLTVLQICSHMPHPTHRSCSTTSRSA